MSQPRRSRRIIRRIDPLTVLKFSALFYLSLYLILLVAGVVLWLAASVSGVRENIESFVDDLGFTGFHFVGSEVLQASAIGGAVMVLVGTGVHVLMAVLYNLISDVTGGISVTVEDRASVEPSEKPAVSAARRNVQAKPQPKPQPKLRPGKSKVKR